MARFIFDADGVSAVFPGRADGDVLKIAMF